MPIAGNKVWTFNGSKLVILIQQNQDYLGEEFTKDVNHIVYSYV
jgi:hypothetical protein